jgi:phosphoribosylformylglycinamidine cyclo-ligase
MKNAMKHADELRSLFKKLNKEKAAPRETLEPLKALVKGVAKACQANECSLVGGETSIQPGVLSEGTYVLTSSMVGIVDRDRIIDGSKIKEGDIVIALSSNGLHTNGYTLVRKLMELYPGLESEKVAGQTFLEAILVPHKPYYKELKGIYQKPFVHGLAHITGGGIEGNLNRVMPKGLQAEIDLTKIKVLPLFAFIKEKGNVPDDDMLKTFNMGVGMTVVVDPSGVGEFVSHIGKTGGEAYPIGVVKVGDAPIAFKGHVVYQSK